MKDRTFFRRKRKVRIVEYDEWIAVLDPVLPKSKPWPGRTADAEAFQRAGWRLTNRSKIEDFFGKTVAQVFVREDQKNQLLLALGSVIVKFADDVKISQVYETLASLKLQLKKELTFANNLFVVAAIDQVFDVIEIADTLLKVDGCEFAEPEFLEAISIRTLQGAESTFI